MEFKVVWSITAEKYLDKIFEYYLKEVNENIAKKIILDIVTYSKILGKNQYIGKVEELLSERVKTYRFLICKNYKIIYSVYEKNKYVLIVAIFDTRQNPEKITNLI